MKCPHHPTLSKMCNVPSPREPNTAGPTYCETVNPKLPCPSKCDFPILYSTSSVPFIVKIHNTKMISIIRIKLASFLGRSEEHTSELQSRENLVCRLLLE